MKISFTTSRVIKNFTLSFGIPFSQFGIFSTTQLYRKPTAWTRGISSRCMDGRHVIFLDYDAQDLTQIEGEIRFLQNYFKLSSAYVFANDKKDSFHVIFLDKLRFIDAYNILRETNIDSAYIESVKMVRGREWILRTEAKGQRNKPFFLKVIRSRFDWNEISTAHKLYLIKHYGVPNIPYKQEDNNSIIPLIDYNTGNKVSKEKGGFFDGKGEL